MSYRFKNADRLKRNREIEGETGTEIGFPGGDTLWILAATDANTRWVRFGDDYINGGDGDDDINAGPGNDTIDGGDGRDDINYNDDGDDNDNHNDGHGIILNLSGSAITNVDAEGRHADNVAAGTAIDTWGTTDTISNIEVIYGSDAGGRSFSSQLAKVYGAEIPEEAKRLIFGENLKRLMMPILQAKGVTP